MADVTDSAFRFIISKYSKDKSVPRSLGEVGFVTWTEFVSADGLIKAPETGKKKLLKDLEYTEIERPIVAQLFTGNPEIMKKAAELVAELGFDGLDINMGCPDKSIEKQNAGAALMKNPALARSIIASAKMGIKEASERLGKTEIPVSVKTRLGYNEDKLEEWLPELLAENPAVITLHARTRKEMSKVPARWERVKRAVEIRDEIQKEKSTLIFGNGDVVDVSHAKDLAKETGCDGVMLGRAIFGNPYLFSSHTPDLKEKLMALLEHCELFDKNLGDIKSFAIMKKHFKSYVKDFPNTHDLKNALLNTNSLEEVREVIKNFLMYN